MGDIPINKESTYSDYPPLVYKSLFDVEQRHFWFNGRNIIIRSVVKHVVGEPDRKTFLEIGCGTGFVLSFLEKQGFIVTGLDMHKESMKFAKRRTKAPLVCIKLEKFFTKKNFDIIGAFDVLEHVDNQMKFLEKSGKLLKKGGRLFLTVPARKELWSKIDEFSGHKRRYDKAGLASLLKKSGFKVEMIKYFGFFLLFPQWAIRRYQNIKMSRIDKKDIPAFFKETINPPPLLMNEFFRLLFYIESKLIGRISFPIGSSLIVAAIKNGAEIK